MFHKTLSIYLSLLLSVVLSIGYLWSADSTDVYPYATPIPVNTFDIDFENHVDGYNYSVETAAKDFGRVLWLNNPERMTLIDHAIEVIYPAKLYGPDNTGAQFKVKLVAADEYMLEYKLKFHAGFDFTAKGGKLPGLGGGKANTGLNIPVGDGWTTRFMWREGGKAKLYIYHMNQPHEYGEYFDLNFSFQDDVWYTLKQRVKVNNGADNNGEVEVWIDGEHLFLKKDFKFRTNNQAPVDIFYFSTFIGGGDESWSLDETGHISFDDFKLTKPIASIPTPTPGYPEWDADIQYKTDDIVKYNAVYWQARWWNNNEKPGYEAGNPWREFTEVTPVPRPTPTATPVKYVNIALNKMTYKSSDAGALFPAEYAVDGDLDTSWGAVLNAKQAYLYVDLGKIENISGIIINWNNPYYATHYKVAVSNDAKNWYFAYEQSKGNGGKDIIIGETQCRFVGVYCTDRTNNYTFSIKELEVYKKRY